MTTARLVRIVRVTTSPSYRPATAPLLPSARASRCWKAPPGDCFRDCLDRSPGWSVELLSPVPPAEETADHYDGESYRRLPDGVWRFIEDSLVQARLLCLEAISIRFPRTRVRVLPRSIGALGAPGSSGWWLRRHACTALVQLPAARGRLICFQRIAGAADPDHMRPRLRGPTPMLRRVCRGRRRRRFRRPRAGCLHRSGG